MSEHVPAVSYQGISALRRLEQSPPEVEIVRKTQRPIPSTHNQKKTTQMSREKTVLMVQPGFRSRDFNFSGARRKPEVRTHPITQFQSRFRFIPFGR